MKYRIKTNCIAGILEFTAGSSFLLNYEMMRYYPADATNIWVLQDNIRSKNVWQLYEGATLDWYDG